MKTRISHIAAIFFTGILLSGNAFAEGEMTVEGTVKNVNCFGSNDGSIDIQVSGGVAPYTYVWNNGVTTEDLRSVYGGTYTVTVTDANNQAVSRSFKIQRPRPISIMVDVKDQTSASVNDGNITAYVNGGVQPYTYAWDNGIKEQNLQNLKTGEYTLTVTDNNGCDLSMNMDVKLIESVPVSSEEEIFTSVNNK